MVYNRAIRGYLSRKRVPIGLQPAAGWTAILGLSFFTIMLILAGGGKILNVAFPAGAFIVGAFLYFRYPSLYLSYTWWMFFLTPLVRRLADYRSGFTNPSPILVAPFLVALVTLVNLWQNFPKSHRLGAMPFILSIIGVFYGSCIGLILNPPMKLAIGFLNWLVPIIFGYYLFVNWRNYPTYRQTIQRTFLWGVLVMGTYGIFQYLVAPEWDRLWVINGGIASIGKVEPLQIRVWSTLDSAGPFANVMKASLLLLFVRVGTLAFISSAVGYLSFLLTLVRAAWGGWFVGLLCLASSFKLQSQMRLVTIILVMGLLVFPLATMEPFAETLNERFETLENVEEDGSARARQTTYQELIQPALTNFIGKGIRVEGFDSALLTMQWQLGWLGLIPYLGGMLLLIFSVFKTFDHQSDGFVNAIRAVIASTIVQFPFGNLMVDTNGMIFWSFLGMGMAAKKYYFAKLKSN